MRWLLIDEVIEIKRGQSAKARSHIRNPGVSPQLLMVEMMAQAGALILGAEKDFKEDVVFTKIQKAEFSPDFLEGDAVEIEATCDQIRAEGAWFEGVVRRGDTVVASSRFLLMNVGHLKETVSTKPVTGPI